MWWERDTLHHQRKQRLEALISQAHPHGLSATVHTVQELPDFFRPRDDVFTVTLHKIPPLRQTLARNFVVYLAHVLAQQDPIEFVLGEGTHIGNDTYMFTVRFIPAIPVGTAPAVDATSVDISTIVNAGTALVSDTSTQSSQAAPKRKLVLSMKNIERATQVATRYIEENNDLLMHYDEEVQDTEWSTEDGETNELTVYTRSSDHNFNGEYIVQLADDYTIISVYTVRDECSVCVSEALEARRDYERGL